MSTDDGDDWVLCDGCREAHPRGRHRGRATLTAELEALEASDPAVAKAAANYDRVRASIIAKSAPSPPGRPLDDIRQDARGGMLVGGRLTAAKGLIAMCQDEVAKADARTEKAEARLAEYQREVERRDEYLAGADHRLAEAEVECRRLREALAKYGRHTLGCDSLPEGCHRADHEHACTCGWADAKAALEPAK